MYNLKKIKYIPLSLLKLEDTELSHLCDITEYKWPSSAGNFSSQFEYMIGFYLGVRKLILWQNTNFQLNHAFLASKIDISHEALSTTINLCKFRTNEPILMDCYDSFCIVSIKLENLLVPEYHIKNENQVCNVFWKNTVPIIIFHTFRIITYINKIVFFIKKIKFSIFETTKEVLEIIYICIKFASIRYVLNLSMNDFIFGIERELYA
jgi:dTDP-4-amino-4,6-dideoxygalactose transaminase